ncbi:hypothetical protein QS752_25600, partial [Escherichia coli]|nr:hypothetical protein [Escherichia coli]
MRYLWEELGQNGKRLGGICNNLTVCENKTGPKKNRTRASLIADITLFSPYLHRVHQQIACPASDPVLL